MSTSLEENRAAIVLEDLRKEFPDMRGTPLLLDSFIEQIDKAKSYGLDSDAELSAYVAVAWLMGAEFDETFPRATKILRNSLMPGEMKASWLVQWCARAFTALVED